MNILAHLQELDDLIVEHTKPPVTTMLRNKVSLCIEQAQTRNTEVERQEQTLSCQIETIERLMKEKSEVDGKLSQIKAKIAQMNLRGVRQNHTIGLARLAKFRSKVSIV